MTVRPTLLPLSVVIVLALVAALLVPLATPAYASTPAPSASLDVPESTLLGSEDMIEVTFDNLASDATGYGPYLDLYLPLQGADGDPSAGETPDGVTFEGATYLGSDVNVTAVDLECDGDDMHPYTGATIDCGDLSGIGAGDALYVLELPFGSFTPTQPAATVEVDLALSELADLDVPLPVHAAAGFRYGDSATGSTPIVQDGLTDAEVTPALVELEKTYLGPEDETATGPNFPRTWLIELTVAEDQPLDDVTLTDLLPGNVAFLDARIVEGTGDITTQPDEGDVGNDAVVEATFPSVVGTGGVSAAFEIDFYVPEFDADEEPVLDPTTGAFELSENHIAATGEWEPLDERDDPTTFEIDEDGPEHVLSDQSLAIQKTVEVVGGGEAAPGAELEWTLQFQISDYFTFEALEIADVLSDGQSLVGGDGNPTMDVQDANGDATEVDLGDYLDIQVDDAPACDADGDITWDLDLSAATEAAMPGTDGRLTGGLVDGDDDGPTQGTITYRTVIEDQYRCLDDGDAVDSLDVLTNDVDLSGEVVEDEQATGNRASDGSAADIAIVAPSFEKSVYARNGDTGDTGPQFAAGDTVTYRLTAELPLTNHEPIDIVDYLPLPVLEADEVTDEAFDQGPSSTPPAAGTISYGPDETRATVAGGVGVDPTFTTDATGNSVTLDFPAIQDETEQGATTIDLLFTVTLTSAPFVDGLFLTNQARMTFGDSFELVESHDAIDQFELTNPQPAIHKGVVATVGLGTLEPEPVGPGGTWTIDDEPRFDEAVTTAGLQAVPLGSDLRDAWGGDRVAFAVVVENQGSGLNGAFDVTIQDTLPDGLEVPAGGLDLQVTDGNGDPLTHTELTDGLFGDGILLENGDDEGTEIGSLSPVDEDSGTNLVVLTYELEVSEDVDVATVATNTATITNFAAAPDGESYPEVEDDATVRVAEPELAKSLTSTSHTDPLREATIGETATYEVTVTVPPSETDDVVLQDRLDEGLAFVSFDSLVASDEGLYSSNGDLADIVEGIDENDVIDGGRQVDIDLGTLTNDTGEEQTLTFTSTVAVTNVPANQDTTSEDDRRNQARFLVDDAPVGNDARADSLILVEPELTVAKSVDPEEADAADTVSYTITVEHPTGDRRSDAFDVAFADVVPDGLTYEAGSFAHDSGLAPDALGDDDDLWAEWDEFPVGQSSTFTFEATVNPDAVVGDGHQLTNTAEVSWTSLPDDDGGSESPFSDDDVQRTGEDGPGELNDYVATGSVTLDIAPAEIDKSFVEGSAEHTSGSELTIGEVASYEVVVTLPEGELGEVVFSDAIPDGLAYIGDSLEVDSSDFQGTLGTPVINLDPEGGTSGERLTVTYDDVIADSGDGTSDTELVFTYDTVVLDATLNQHGETRTNTAGVSVAGETVAEDEDTVTLVEPTVAIDKTFGFPDAAPGDEPDSAAANDAVTVTLTVENTSDVDAFDLEVEDVLDGDVFTDVTASVVGDPSGWSVSVAEDDGDHVVVGLGEVLASGDDVQIEIDARLVADVPAGGSHTNVAAVTWTSLPDDPDDQREYGPSTGEDTLDFIVPDLVVTKDVDGSVDIEPGDEVTYDIAVTNVGGREAADVMLVDILPDHVTFVSAADDGTESGGEVTWPAFDLAAGDTWTTSLTVDVDDPVPAGTTTLVNTATANDDGSRGDDPTPDDNTDTATVGLEAFVDLTVDKNADVSAVTPGETFTYDLTVTSLGNEGADDISLTDELPEHVSFVTASDGGTEDGGTVSWPGFALDGADGAETSRTFTVTVQVDDTVPAGVTSISNTATVDHPDDEDPDNNSSTENTPLDAVPDLTVTKTDGQDTVVSGETLVYTIVVSNVGDQGATGVTVEDTLPTGLTFVSASDDGVHDDGEITWDLADELAAGDSVELALEVVVDDPLPDGTTSLTNVVTTFDDGSNGPDPTPEDNTSTDTNVTGADLEVAKAAVEPLVPGARTAYEIVVTNDGPETVTELTVVDTLPSGLSDARFSPSAGTYDASSGAWEGLELAPGDEATLLVDVAVSLDAEGELTNRASAGSPDYPDPDPERSTTTTTDPVTPVISLHLTKEVVEHDAEARTATYELEVRNDGPSRATDVTLVDRLPEGLTATSVDGEGWGCLADGRTVTCLADTSMEPDETRDLRIAVAIDEEVVGEVVNEARVTAIEPDSDDETTVAQAMLEQPEPPAPEEVSPEVEEDEPSEASEESSGDALPRTGTDLRWPLLLAALLLLVGFALRRPGREPC